MSASLFWNILLTKLLVYFSISSGFSFVFIAWFISATASSFLSNIVLNILSCLFVMLYFSFWSDNCDIREFLKISLYFI